MNQQRGYTIVELMVGLTAGLIVLLAITAIVFAASQHRHDLERVSRQVENGRYAMTLLADDLSNAGYFGRVRSARRGVARDDPRSMLSRRRRPEDGRIRPRSGVRTRRNDARLHQRSSQRIACARDPTRLHVRCGCIRLRRSDPGRNVHAGKPLRDGACLVHGGRALRGSRTGQQWCVAVHFDPSACRATPAALRRYVVHLYYLAANNEDGDGVPTLKRATLSGGAFTVEPLVEGIEAINFECAVDTNGDGARTP